MKKTAQTTATRTKQTGPATQPMISTAYEVHTLSQMLYGHLAGRQAWPPPVAVTPPWPAATPAHPLAGAGFMPTPGPEPMHGFGINPATPMWTDPWQGCSGQDPAAWCRGGPHGLTGYWKP